MKFNRYSYILIQGNAFEKVIYEMTAIFLIGLKAFRMWNRLLASYTLKRPSVFNFLPGLVCFQTIFGINSTGGMLTAIGHTHISLLFMC